MVRRIAALIDIADVLGVIGLAVIAYGAYLIDSRLPFFVVGAALLLVAVSLASRPAA